MNLRIFEEYLSNGSVKKVLSNKARAESLFKEAESKKEFMDLVIIKISLEKTNPNFIIESSYDIIIEMIRAKMLIAGFNSEKSHEAEVSYMRKLNFEEKEIIFMDELRYYRNGIKYYGKIFDLEYAKKVLDFLNKTYPLLK